MRMRPWRGHQTELGKRRREDARLPTLQDIDNAMERVKRLSREADALAQCSQTLTTQVIGDAWFGPQRISVLPDSPAASMTVPEIVAALDEAAARDSSGAAVSNLISVLAPPPQVG